MRGVIGLDIGGVNTKAVWRDGDALRTVLRPYDVLRDRDALTAVLRDVVAELRRAGGACGADDDGGARRRLPDQARGRRLRARRGRGRVRRTAARPHDRGRAREPRRGAGATARRRRGQLGGERARGRRGAPGRADARRGQHDRRRHPDHGRPAAAAGRSDLDRLLAGELVYTGALRTPLAAIAPRVPVRGRWCPVAATPFAISADVHLILGHLAPEAYTCPTPDGRAASVECARERVARLVCADAEQLEPAEVEAIAAYLHAEQVRQIEAAARLVSTRLPGATPIVTLGGRVPRPRGGGAPRPACARAAVDRGGMRRGSRGRARRLAPRGGPRRADRRQGRRRARAGGRRRGAAGAVRAARGGGRAPSAARRAGRRGVRGRGPRARPPLRPAAADRAPDGDPRDGPVRLGARRPHPGRRALRGARARARRRRLGPAAGRAAGGARPPARVVGRHLGLDRRVGGRRGRRRAPRAE